MARRDTGYEQLFRLNPLPMWVVDAGTSRVMDANDAAVAESGRARDALLALAAGDLGLEEDLSSTVEWEGRPARLIVGRPAPVSRAELFPRLVARLHQQREAERQALSKVIHDQLGQALIAIKLECSRLARHTCPAAAVTGIEKLADESIGRLRVMAASLRPMVLDSLGLVAALEWLAGPFERRTGIRCAVRAETEKLGILPAAEVALFRIAEEALAIAAGDPPAERIEITIRTEGAGILLEVAGDGAGLTELAPGGARSLERLDMEERARAAGGSIEIAGRTAGGTIVRARVPLATQAE